MVKSKKNKIKTLTAGGIVFDIFNILLMLFLCVITLYPYINQIAISLNDGADTAYGGITIFPRVFTLVNYKAALTSTGFGLAFAVSVARVASGTLISLFVTLLCAYVLTKKELPFRRLISNILVIPMFIAPGIIPNYIILRNLHVLNTFWVYILPSAFSFYNMVVMRTYLEGLPKSLDEAALVDGANELQILAKVYLPLCKPMLATLALWVMVMHWNDWTTTLYYINRKELYTLQFIMMQVVKESETVQKMASEMIASGQDMTGIMPTPESVKAATLIIVTFPIICIYPFFQKYFVKGVTLGAVKE